MSDAGAGAGSGLSDEAEGEGWIIFNFTVGTRRLLSGVVPEGGVSLIIVKGTPAFFGDVEFGEIMEFVEFVEIVELLVGLVNLGLCPSDDDDVGVTTVITPFN